MNKNIFNTIVEKDIENKVKNNIYAYISELNQVIFIEAESFFDAYMQYIKNEKKCIIRLSYNIFCNILIHNLINKCIYKNYEQIIIDLYNLFKISSHNFNEIYKNKDISILFDESIFPFSLLIDININKYYELFIPIFKQLCEDELYYKLFFSTIKLYKFKL